MAGQAPKVWTAPELAAQALERYRPSNPDRAPTYTPDDHRQLAEGSISRILFDALCKEVLAIDACVTEKVPALYIAFKAETNFCDVTP